VEQAAADYRAAGLDFFAARTERGAD
jgi:hypothetical protein